MRVLCLALLVTACASVEVHHARVEADGHTVRELHGWSVHVDGALLEGDGKETGDAALALLAARLLEIKTVVPDAVHARLMAVPIWIDLEHELGTMQYHPSVGWLREHGHDVRMEKCVHIPNANGFLGLARTNHQPWVVLHELAHAFHDRELGFENAEIKAAYDAAVEKGDYESVLHINGKTVKHYALTDHKEYFAEASEAYFGTNDFHPFVRAELRLFDARMFGVLEKVWGKVR